MEMKISKSDFFFILYFKCSTYSLLRSRFKLLSTGQTPRYFNWAEHEPNNGGGNQDCVTIGIYDTEKWDDATCSYADYHFACEMEL